MKVRILLPDPLVWEAGIEYGLQSLSKLKNEIPEFIFYVKNNGKLLEAVAFGVFQLGLDENVRYIYKPERILKKCDIILFPRVKTLEKHRIQKALDCGKYAVTSDQDIKIRNNKLFRFHRRNFQELTSIIKKISRKLLEV